MALEYLLTGSRVYGTPRQDSDLDMVVYYENREDFYRLSAMSDPHPKKTQGVAQDYSSGGISLRFGNLNIVAVNEKGIFEAWKNGTNFLNSIKPVTHEQACLVLETLFNIARSQERNKLAEEVPF